MDYKTFQVGSLRINGKWENNRVTLAAITKEVVESRANLMSLIQHLFGTLAAGAAGQFIPLSAVPTKPIKHSMFGITLDANSESITLSFPLSESDYLKKLLPYEYATGNGEAGSQPNTYSD